MSNKGATVNQTIIANLPKANDIELTWISDVVKGSPAQIIRGTKEQLQQTVQSNTNLYLLVDGCCIDIQDIKLPEKVASSKLLVTIGYQLETKLYQNIDDVELIILEEKDLHYTVAIMSKTKRHVLDETIKNMGCANIRIVPDMLALPLEPEQWSIYLNDTNVLVKTSQVHGFVTDRDNFSLLLSLAYQEASEKPKAVKVYNTSNMEENILIQKIQLSDVAIIVDSHQRELLQLAREGIPQLSDINLLSSKSNNMMFDLNISIKRAVGFASALILIYVISLFVESFYVKAQQREIQQAISKVYYDIYPNASAVISPKQRIKQDLKRFQGSRSNKFLDMFLAVANEARKINPNAISSINYQDNKLNLQISVKDFEQLNRLVNAIKTAGFTVTQTGATQQGNKVKATLMVN